MPEGTQEVYLAPKHGWCCFHCGENFRTFGGAQDHFGATPGERPACLIKLGDERGLIMELRKAQAGYEEMLNRALRAEEELEMVQRSYDELKRLTGCDGVNEARCELDNLRGRVAVYDLITDKFRERAPELFAEVIG